MKSYKEFGIKTIIINGFEVYTFKVRVLNTEFNKEKLVNFGFNPKEISSKGNKMTDLLGQQIPNKLEVEFTTMDPQIFKKEKTLLGNALKEIALNNLNIKYNWINK